MRRIGLHHAEWLGLLEVSGPFLSLPVLERVFPQGLDALDTDHAAKLRLAREEWAEEQGRPEPYPEVHDQWIRFVLSETLEYSPEVLVEVVGITDDLTAEVPEHRETLRPDFVLSEPEEDPGGRRARLMIKVYSPAQDLDGLVDGSDWAASPATRMTHLCRSTDVRLGLLTNGERWMLVDAPHGETPAYVSWYASLWTQEPITIRAFQSLLAIRRFFGVDPSDTLEGMLSESATYQAEVTEQLGAQVRRAVEVLVQALDRADSDSGRTLLRDVTEAELYEAALTIMMRLVFLFFAEENDLLPLSDELYQQFYAASTLRGQLREQADEVGVEVLERRQDAWSRLLATFRAIFGGVDHEALRLPAYGGSLFNPDRFPFLEGRSRETTWQKEDAQPLPIDNRTVLHLLDALQLLQMRGGSGTEARKLSFRALGIEQIGHVYEMLLDHQIVRAKSPGLGLLGKKGAEPEISLPDLEEHRSRGDSALLDLLKEETKKSRASLEKALARKPDGQWEDRLRAACGSNRELEERVLPYHALIRSDPWGEPIVIREGSLVVTSGSERRATGTYYTPRALTEEVVTHALEPLVYEGPVDGTPREEWRLKDPRQLLALKVCDPAMGSGAFLVQVVRWLSERLVEAWDEAEGREGATITPEGDAFTGADPHELVVPAEGEERRVLAQRLIADRCIYGVDMNPLAVEMAKLSLWLITLARGRPFSFLDHALKRGDSLLGITHVDQLRHFHTDPDRGTQIHASLFDETRHIDPAIDDALHLRRELESFTVRDVRDANEKALLHRRAEAALDRVRMLGDLLIGAAVSEAVRGPETLDKRLRVLADALVHALGQPGTAADEDLVSEASRMLNEGKPPPKADRRAFHWPIEFPEVFSGRGGFDAIIGNPPFLGGVRISEVLGDDYNTYLSRLFPPFSKRRDLSSLFFRRGAQLIDERGVIGLLATNTISQGMTRKGGLEVLLRNGFQILRSVKSFRWPGDASVIAARVWLYRGDWQGERWSGDKACAFIGALLDPSESEVAAPRRLAANEDRCFQGPTIWGEEFLISEEQAKQFLREDPRNSEVVLPAMGGKDLNTAIDLLPSRWVVAMGERDEETSRQFAGPYQYLDQTVRPWRQSLDPKKYNRVVKGWWKFFHAREDLFAGVERYGLHRVLVRSRVSDHHMVAFLPTGIIYLDALVVFLFDDWGSFSTLQSVIHDEWSRRYASTLKTDVRYVPGDCFYTFPFPIPDAVAQKRLEASGSDYYGFRSSLMQHFQIGMTSLYGRYHDSADRDEMIEDLRRKSDEMDRAVAAAYGWNDLKVARGFYETSRGLRYTVEPVLRNEILDRLLELNHERYVPERKAGGSFGRRR